MEHLFLMFLDHTQRRSCVYVCGVCVCCVWCVWCVWCVYVCGVCVCVRVRVRVCVVCVYVCAWCSLLSKTLSLNHSMTRFHSVRNTTHTHTAQFYNERISTDPILITWQNTVYEPPEDGFKKRPKHVGASVKCFNPYPANVENMVNS